MKISELIALLFSVVAIGISIWTNVETSNYRHEQDTSKVVIQVQRNFSQEYIKFHKYTGPYNYKAIYRQKYHIILNNLGFQPASIVDWRTVASMPVASAKEGKTMWGWYVGMDPQFLDKNGKKIQPPFTIYPKKPIALTLELGIRVPNAAWEATKKYFSYNLRYAYQVADRKFSQAGFPQFGQYQLTRVESDKGILMKAYGAGFYEQKFTLYLTKGNGTQVSAIVTPNISLSFLQGQNSGTSWNNVRVE